MRRGVPKQSAGILMYRFRGGLLEVFLVHPGGPLWTKRDQGAWSIPKGEFSEPEEPLEAARREFEEETGIRLSGELTPLGSARQPGGKMIHIWAKQGDCDAASITSNTFSMEWPPKSGKQQEFPEIERASWFPVEAALKKVHQGQVIILDRLLAQIRDKSVTGTPAPE